MSRVSYVLPIGGIAKVSEPTVSGKVNVHTVVPGVLVAFESWTSSAACTSDTNREQQLHQGRCWGLERAMLGGFERSCDGRGPCALLLAG